MTSEQLRRQPSDDFTEPVQNRLRRKLLRAIDEEFRPTGCDDQLFGVPGCVEKITEQPRHPR